jgi:glycosyltransferase involved in cell wall biosynthesis|tara:strand:- start:646 stop:1857 length:1212 start_codon:yes stop_codon:yes gene_type:complete
MRVLQINNYHRIVGGSDAVYFNTGALLEAHGHEVGWFAGFDRKAEPCEDVRFFPRVVDMENLKPWDMVRYMRNREAAQKLGEMLVERGHFDVAHLHIYYGRLTAAVLGPLRAQGIPIVQSLHEYKLACPIYTLERNGDVCEKCVTGSTVNLLRYRCKGSLVRSAAAFAEYHTSRWQGDISKIDRFICVSDFQRHIMARSGVPEAQMVTLHNFVDPERLTPRDPVPREEYLLYLGRIEKLKGVHTLIDAVRKTGMKLRIAGTGAWTKEMATEIADMSNVEYLGFVSGDPLRRLMAGAKAVVVPSEWYENCPMSVLEAKAVGTPVIGTRMGGIPELVRDGQDGFLFEAGDSDDLAGALEALEGADREALGAAAKADVEDRFSPLAHLAALMDIYEDVGAHVGGEN